MNVEAGEPMFKGSSSHDLHVDGAEHDHEFTKWSSESGVEEYDNCMIGFVRFESHCTLCPARVGRVFVTEFPTEPVA